MAQQILQNANPPGPADQNVPVNSGSSSQIHTPGTDSPGTPSDQGGVDVVASGAGYNFVAEKGTSAEGRAVGSPQHSIEYRRWLSSTKSFLVCSS
jgi:hypothetical protein